MACLSNRYCLLCCAVPVPCVLCLLCCACCAPAPACSAQNLKLPSHFSSARCAPLRHYGFLSRLLMLRSAHTFPETSWGFRILGCSCSEALTPPHHALHDMPSTILQRSMNLQAAPAQKNLGTSGELDVMQPAQTSASRTQAVGTASQLRTAAFKLLLMGCRSSGAAFIKWGQWSATREDIFPAVSQSMQHTASKIERFCTCFQKSV